MSFYPDLAALIQTHPTYPTVTDEELLIWLTEEVVTSTKPNLPNEGILAIILSNRAEFTALSEADKQIVRDILYIGDSVPTEAGQPARDTLVNIYGGQSLTIQSLAAEITILISRAVNAGIIETIRLGDIEFARTI